MTQKTSESQTVILSRRQDKREKKRKMTNMKLPGLSADGLVLDLIEQLAHISDTYTTQQQ